MDNLLDLLCDICKAYGVHMRCYGESLSNLEEYDDGLRSRLFQINDSSRFAQSLRDAEQLVLYTAEDAYNCRYYFFRPPQNNDPVGSRLCYCVIGPWLESRPDETAIDNILRKNNIPYHLRPELVQYFELVPLVTSPRSWEAMLLAFVSYLYGGAGKVRLSRQDFGRNEPSGTYSPEPKETLAMQVIEERYRNETAMLAAVSKGDAQQAIQCLTRFRGYPGWRRAANELRDRKNHCIVLNSLARKAAENGYVHPAHLDAVSADFARRIEAASGTADITHLSETMLRRYCALVEEFSLRNFSPLIRNVINTIDFSLHEALSLDSLARRFYVNPSHLSSQFKHEKGETLTGYINTKRLQHAASLLRGSGAYIQEIAEQCGFLDLNYFSRLFKRHYGKTPREFRAELQDGPE